MPTGRFAPSPTGPLHLGSLRTALVAWLLAKSTGDTFLIRVEDLDPVASRREHEASQLADLRDLGVESDGPIVRQSERLDLYETAIASLTEAGLTYPCFCTRREIAEAASAPHEHLPEGAYTGTCRGLASAERAELMAQGRRAALRLRAEGRVVGFADRWCGFVEGQVDDFVLRRNDGMPAYNLAVVVDDAAQGIGEVVRGDDLLLSTPRQLHLAALLGLPTINYAHVPLVLGPDGRRLAKRDGAVTLDDRRKLGDTVDDVRSLLATSLGLAELGERVSMAELGRRFDPDQLPRSPWMFTPAGAADRPGTRL